MGKVVYEDTDVGKINELLTGSVRDLEFAVGEDAITRHCCTMVKTKLQNIEKILASGFLEDLEEDIFSG